MALSTILRRSASRFISGGNRIYGNLILPGASVPAFRQFSSSSSKDNESLVNDAKQPSSLDDLITQFQSLQRDIELLRNSYSQPPLSAVKVEESLPQGQGVEESDSVHNGIDDDSFDSFLKGRAIESSDDQVEDCESDKSDDDSKDQGKGGSDSDDSSSDDSSSDDSSSDDSSSDDSSSDDDQGKGGSDSDDSSSDDSSSDEKKSSTDGDNSNDESLSEADDKNENSDHEWLSDENGETVPERDENSESGDTLPKPDDESLPKSKENEELLKGIEAEILRAKTFMELSAPAAVIPADFPFKIRNCYSENYIWMAQEYEGELVEVYVESPTIFMNRPCNDYKEKKSSPFSMDLTVVVSDLSSKSMKVELQCCARPGGISVNSASDPEGHHEVHMSDVNGNLIEEFGKYLEARGITLSTTEFIYGYMLDKANKERLRILENIQKMVSA